MHCTSNFAFRLLIVIFLLRLDPSDLSAPPGLEQQILSPPSQNDVQQYSTTVVSSTATASVLNNNSSVNNGVQYPELHPAPTSAQQLRQALEMPQLSQTTSLSAEQSQYFSTLSSQNTAVNAFQPTSVQYSQYSDQVSSQQAPVRRQRARVPPPSKIPSSAVEMPGDSLNTIGYLDVQFGGLDFGTDDSFEAPEKFATIDGSQSGPQASDVSDYQTKQGGGGVPKASQGLTAGLQSAQLVSGQTLIPVEWFANSLIFASYRTRMLFPRCNRKTCRQATRSAIPT